MGRRAIVFGAAAGVFVLDRWSKWIIETRLSPFDTKVLFPGFLNVVNSQNPGVAFGIFAESASKYRTAALVVFSLVAVAVLAAMLWRVERVDRRTAAGLALIFGGAVGNVFDRIRSGMVTDFLDFYVGTVHWYTFNLADSAICVGAGLLLLSMLRPGTHAA
ncbi:MAG: signal peptidase Aspartic peptidase [Bryobacterales bacterium]|jgi:signal peptidase II|nr:signal peptidase Aspartic peptidase [Bryobacterales bacterium]